MQSTAAYNFGYTSADPNTRACPAASTSFVPAAATLASFTVTVVCTATADANGGPTIYVIQSTACNQPNAGSCPNTVSPNSAYIERRLTLAF